MRINKVAGGHVVVYSAVTIVALLLRAFIGRRLVGGVCSAAMLLFIPPLQSLRTTFSGAVDSWWRQVFSGWPPIPKKYKTLTRQKWCTKFRRMGLYALQPVSFFCLPLSLQLEFYLPVLISCDRSDTQLPSSGIWCKATVSHFSWNPRP